MNKPITRDRLTTSACNGSPVFAKGSGARLTQYLDKHWKRGGTVDKPKTDLSTGSRIGDAAISRGYRSPAKKFYFPQPFRQGPYMPVEIPAELVKQFALRSGDLA